MKHRISIVAISALMLACSPKTVVQPTTPQTPEPPKTDLASLEIAKGKALYENKCGNCHRLFAPSEETAATGSLS